MKKYIFLFISIVYSIMCNAQIDIKTSQLLGKKWERVLPAQMTKGDTIFLEFTETRIVISDYYRRQEEDRFLQLLRDYYITDKLPSYSEFKRKYVGKERKGCYIVFYNDKVNEIDYWTVLSLTDDELVLYHKAYPGAVPNRDIKIVYKRVK